MNCSHKQKAGGKVQQEVGKITASVALAYICDA